MKKMPSAVRYKLARIQGGEPPRVLDLFAGCGGISLGFASAGFEIVGAVEFDPVAAKSHALNFHRNLPEAARAIHGQARDITETDPAELLREFGCRGRVERHVDIIVGGPPCQAFARVGRAKLREVAEHPEAYLRDPRGDLYLRYVHYVQELKPVALLMENVPDVLNYGGHNIAEEVCEVLGDLGYEARYTTLNAVYYGVPEMRERMFLVAYRREIPVQEWFPRPTHWIDLPKGYHGTRQVALQTIRSGDLFEDGHSYVEPPPSDPRRNRTAVTAEEALSDLPRLSSHLNGGLTKGARRFTERLPYHSKPLNSYQSLMRNWSGFDANSEGVVDHVIRYLPRDYKLFRRMNPGDQYPEAYMHALALFEERLAEVEHTTGKRPGKGTKLYEQLKKDTVPPYDPGKFPNKWRKMEANWPARTLMAHLGKDSYSHIHYDSTQARTISVREAARLQSFPDGFAFEGPMNPAFRQIGNAVPPLMAQALARRILTTIREQTDVEEVRGKALNCN